MGKMGTELPAPGHSSSQPHSNTVTKYHQRKEPWQLLGWVSNLLSQQQRRRRTDRRKQRKLLCLGFDNQPKIAEPFIWGLGRVEYVCVLLWALGLLHPVSASLRQSDRDANPSSSVTAAVLCANCGLWREMHAHTQTLFCPTCWASANLLTTALILQDAEWPPATNHKFYNNSEQGSHHISGSVMIAD